MILIGRSLYKFNRDPSEFRMDEFICCFEIQGPRPGHARLAPGPPLCRIDQDNFLMVF